jgi:hypothetical protein
MLDPNAVIRSGEQADQIMQDQRAEIARLQDEIERLRVNLRLADAGFTFGQPTFVQPTLTDAERFALGPSLASAGCLGDTLSVLRTLIDGVRGMGLGDPDCGDRIEATDVVRWAVDEIERLRLTDEERAAIEFKAAHCVTVADQMHQRCAVTLLALLERTK